MEILLGVYKSRTGEGLVKSLGKRDTVIRGNYSFLRAGAPMKLSMLILQLSSLIADKPRVGNVQHSRVI